VELAKYATRTREKFGIGEKRMEEEFHTPREFFRWFANNDIESCYPPPYRFPDGTDLVLRVPVEIEKEDEHYREGTQKIARRFIRRFWSLFISYQPTEREVQDVESEISTRAKRFLKALLQILALQLCIEFLLDSLLFLLDSECLQPSILSYHWVKRHGARPPRNAKKVAV
jgi:hypothetical protein